MKRRILSSALVLVMVLSLMIVPSITASAADASVTVNVVDGSFDYDEAKLPLLCDGEAAPDATAFSDARYASFQNTGFVHTDGIDAAVEGTLEIVVDLGEVKTINGATLSLYVESISMIDAPTAVRIYGSNDGKSWYNLNAENGAAIPEGDGQEIAVAVDFSTRANFDVQYVKAVITIKTGWIFASELAVNVVEAANGEHIAPAGPYSVNMHSGSGIVVLTAEDQPEGGFDLATELEGRMKNAQLTKAKATDVEGKYEITFNKVNPWPDGHSGTMTLADDEILIVNTTSGAIGTGDSYDVNSAAKWAARGLTPDAEDDGKGNGDFVYLSGDEIYFYAAGYELVVDNDSDNTTSEPAGDESKIDPPATGEMTPVVVIALVVILACGATIVVSKRRA